MAGSGGKYVEKKKKCKIRVFGLLSKGELPLITHNFTSDELNTAL